MTVLQSIYELFMKLNIVKFSKFTNLMLRNLSKFVIFQSYRNNWKDSNFNYRNL